MIKACIKTTNSNLDLNLGINNVVIEDVNEFRKVYYHYETEIIIYDFNKDIKYNAITNPLDIDLNFKKAISFYTKEVVLEIRKKHEEDYCKLILELFNLLKTSSFECENEISFDNDVSIEKLINLFNIRIENKENFISNFTDYLCLVQRLEKVAVFITFNLCKSLSSEEFNLLNTEIEVNDLILLNIEYIEKGNASQTTQNTIIDEDFCII